MTSIVPINENSLNLPSAADLAATYIPDPTMYHYLVDVPVGFLPELRELCAALQYMTELVCGYVQFPCHPKAINHFLNSAEYRTLRDQLGNEEAASEEDAERVIKTIISSHILQQNISPRILAEVFMEIIRELGPTKPALHFARVSMRNSQTFVPSPKEFRDTLISAINSVSTLAEMISVCRTTLSGTGTDWSYGITFRTSVRPTSCGRPLFSAKPTSTSLRSATEGRTWFCWANCRIDCISTSARRTVKRRSRAMWPPCKLLEYLWRTKERSTPAPVRMCIQ